MPGRAAAFGVECTDLDSTDVFAVHAAAARAVDAVRSAGRPHVLSLRTYRMAAHSKGDDTRTAEEIAEARAHDPLRVTAAMLDPAERAAIEERCERELAEAVARAEASPVAGRAAEPA